MKNFISAAPRAEFTPNPGSFVAFLAGGQSLIFLFRAMAVVLLFAIAPTDAIAQCPGTTYSVGSGVGILNLSAAPVGVANLTAGQSIQITGTFIVDAGTWNITGANVYFTTSASEIIVNGGKTLDASAGSIFQGCNATYKWSAIKVLAGGIIKANACTFNNGLNAVDIGGAAEFRLNGNTFNTCTNGLRITGPQNTANHTIASNTFLNAEQAGILLSSTSSITIGFNTYTETGTPQSTAVLISLAKYILIDGGVMNQIKFGLDIQAGQSWCIEMANVLFRGTYGVRSNQARYGLTIRDCEIIAGSTAIDITNHLTTQTLPPGFLCDGNIKVLRNVINTDLRTGIRIANINGNGTVTVQGNRIGIPTTTSPIRWFYGIQIFESPNANIVVDDNRVRHGGNSTPSTFPGGIYLYNCKANNLVSNNRVSVAPDLTDYLNFGIAIVNSPHCNVRDNTVDGSGANIDRAISIENPVTDIDLCCNTMTHAELGLYMLGAHEDCIIQTSLFGRLTEALYYDMVVSTSAPQIHKGNDWSGATTTWDAYFNGTPFGASSVKYRVDPSLLPNGLSQIFVTGGNASDWFSTPAAGELNCASICGNGFAGEGGGEGLQGNDYWAINALSDPTYATLQWMAKQDLYAKLVAHPILLSNTQASTFYNSAQSGNIGKFYTIKTGIESLYDTTLTANPVQKLADLQLLNASIVTETAYQANEKTINSLRLAALAQDDWDFSESEKAAIDGIAALCPQSGGSSVYVARYLQENYRVPYWNMDCAFVGARDAGVTPKATGFAVFPNPANDALNVTFEQHANNDCRVELLSITGQVLYTQIIPEGVTSITMPVYSFPNGYYLVCVSGKGQSAKFQKITIIR